MQCKVDIPVMAPTRRFIAEAEAAVTEPDGFVVQKPLFLFNDLLVIGKNRSLALPDCNFSQSGTTITVHAKGESVSFVKLDELFAAQLQRTINAAKVRLRCEKT